MTWLGKAWQWFGNSLEWNDMERFENGVEIPMTWNGITWQGMTMAWHQ